MYNDFRWENSVWDEERRLMREINAQKGLSFSRFKKIFQLSALARSYRR